MLALALLVASIAIADSVNPSTVVPALWQAGAPRARGLGCFTLGVFAVYLAGGVLLVLGPGPALIAALHQIRGTLEHVLLAAGGLVALAFAAILWRSRGRVQATGPLRRCSTRRSAFTLGAGIMAVELPTAFMYFGAISAIVSAHRAVMLRLSLIVTYNLVFVAPLVAILAIRLLARERGDRWLATGELWLRSAGQIVLAGVAAAAGAALVVVGVGGLVAA